MKNHPQLFCSNFSPGWDNRAFYLRLMSLQTKPPREATHIWQSRPVWESQRTQWHGEQTVPSVPHWHWTPLALPSAHCLSTLALFEPRSQTQDRRVGRLMCLSLSDSHTHVHTHMLLLPQASMIWRTHPGRRIVLVLANAGPSTVTCDYGSSYALQSCHEPLKIDTASHTVWAATFKREIISAQNEHWQNRLHLTF